MTQEWLETWAVTISECPVTTVNSQSAAQITSDTSQEGRKKYYWQTTEPVYAMLLKCDRFYPDNVLCECRGSGECWAAAWAKFLIQ